MLGLQRREQFRALRFSSDFADCIEAVVLFGSVMARRASGLVVDSAAFGSSAIDGEWIARRTNVLGKIRLPLD